MTDKEFQSCFYGRYKKVFLGERNKAFWAFYSHFWVFFVTLVAKNSGKLRLSYTLAGNFTRRGGSAK
jgi:hypothetical protein